MQRSTFFVLNLKRLEPLNRTELVFISQLICDIVNTYEVFNRDFLIVLEQIHSKMQSCEAYVPRRSYSYNPRTN